MLLSGTENNQNSGPFVGKLSSRRRVWTDGSGAGLPQERVKSVLNYFNKTRTTVLQFISVFGSLRKHNLSVPQMQYNSPLIKMSLIHEMQKRKL